MTKQALLDAISKALDEDAPKTAAPEPAPVVTLGEVDERARFIVNGLRNPQNGVAIVAGAFRGTAAAFICAVISHDEHKAALAPLAMILRPEDAAHCTGPDGAPGLDPETGKPITAEEYRPGNYI